MKYFMIIGLLLAISTMGQFSSHRQLLIFKSLGDVQLAEQQLSSLEKAAGGVNERDIKITIVEKESPLFKKYSVDTARFTVILIGKDGFEKYRTNKLLDADQLFSIIDAMPMRQREMNKNRKNDGAIPS
jgi:hypothetical protein